MTFENFSMNSLLLFFVEMTAWCRMTLKKAHGKMVALSNYLEQGNWCEKRNRNKQLLVSVFVFDGTKT